MTFTGIFAVSILALLLGLQAWRLLDRQSASTIWAQLAAPSEPVGTFDPAMVEGLPPAAQRYFLHSIAPGTRLHRVSEIRMHGEIGLGEREAPNYQPMRAIQILAPPHGFVWRLEGAGSGPMRMSGSDGMAGAASWTRFWLDWTIPVVRVGHTEDHLRSSFGRAVAESVLWAPAALLPQNGVVWEEGATPNRARAVMTRGALTQSLEIEVDDDGRPLWVMIPRWSNANPDGQWRVQPFGGTLGEFRRFDGFTLPTRIDGGNHFGTDDYFPFFRARVEDIRFPAVPPVATGSAPG